MKAIVHYNNIDAAPTTVKGKDLRIHLDGPQAYHISEGYKGGEFEQHQILGIFTDVFRIALEGKPKKAKPKRKPAVDSITIDIDTSKLQTCIKEAMLELEGLADKEQYIHKEDIDDDYLDKNISAEALAQYGVTAARAERDQLQKEVVELRLAIEQLAFVPPDVATAAKLLDAELLIFLDHAGENFAINGEDKYNAGFENGVRFAIGKLTGKAPAFKAVTTSESPATAPAPAFQTTAIVEDTKLVDAFKAPLPSQPAALPPCVCPPKRNIDKLGHLSYCPNSPHYNDEELAPDQPPKE